MLLIEMMIIVAMITCIEISTARMVATAIIILDMLIIAINSVNGIFNDWTVRPVFGTVHHEYHSYHSSSTRRIHQQSA